MIRAARLAVSRPMYAFKPDTWRERYVGSFEVDAVWFKRKDGILSAVIGTYHPMVLGWHNEPTDGTYESWIAAADDNRYGGSWAAKWNGDGLLCFDTPVAPDTVHEHIDFLNPMLKNFPDVPTGYDGWWTFPRGT
ncbi:hypothetical protein [Actinoplanes sp. NPDC051494]|uniref:hypothetical protein n=1 Tax=Actinoplanes sp. NPDC051494 TaxID=3363907 RepID=UPI0037B6D042